MFWKDIKHFKKNEFACRCGCGLNDIHIDLVKKLDEAREIACVPFYLHSACRCVNHNRLVGGSLTSSHLEGLAVDIDIPDSATRYKILVALLRVGFNRMGVYRDFIHADIDLDKTTNVVWYK